MPSKGNSFTEYSEKPGSRRPGLLKNQLRLVRRVMPDGKARKEIAPVEEQLSFEKGFFLFIRAVQLLTQNNAGVILVGLAGPSGAGKTAFTHKVAGFMPSIAVLSMDHYNVASRVIDGNFDDPRITDYELLLENIEGLRRGEAVQVPIYDFKSSQRVGFREQTVPKSRVIILEGIHALNERVRPLLDLRVAITGGVHFDLVKRVLRDIDRSGQAPESIIQQISETNVDRRGGGALLLDLRVTITGGVHFDLVKRVLRDIDRSGQAPESIIQQISETVYPMYKAFIEPELKTAHIRMVNNFNPFSGFQDATYLLKSRAEGEGWEERVRAVLAGGHAREEVETYEIYLLPPGEDKDTCQSYLRMRNRDGRYSLMFEIPHSAHLPIRSFRLSPPPSLTMLGCSSAASFNQSLTKEWVTDGPFVITPRITFSVSVRLLGGLMALGYEIAHIVHRESIVLKEQGEQGGQGEASSMLSVKIDKIEQLKATYVQVIGKDHKRMKMPKSHMLYLSVVCLCVQVIGKDRKRVKEVAEQLGMEGEGGYISHPYIEDIKLHHLTQEIQSNQVVMASQGSSRLLKAPFAAMCVQQLVCSMGVQQWVCSNGCAAWVCSMCVQHGCAACVCSMGVQQCVHSRPTVCFQLLSPPLTPSSRPPSHTCLPSPQPSPLSSNALKARLRISDDILPFSPPVGPRFASPTSSSSAAAASSSWSAGGHKLDKTMPAPTAALAKAEISTMRSACSATALELLKLDARGSPGEGGEGEAEQGRRAVEESPAGRGGGGRGTSRTRQGRGADEQQEGQQQQQQQAPVHSKEHTAVSHVLISLSSPLFFPISFQSPPHPSPPRPSALSFGVQLRSNEVVEGKLVSITQQMDGLLLSRLTAAEQRGRGGQASEHRTADGPAAVESTRKSFHSPPVLWISTVQLQSNEDVEGKLASIAQQMDRLLQRLEQVAQARSCGSSKPPASSLASLAEGHGGRTAEGGPQGQQGSSGGSAVQNGLVFVPLGQDGDKSAREGGGGGSGLQRDVNVVAEQQRHMTRQVRGVETAGEGRWWQRGRLRTFPL
ncbi:unnamed protein product [Closterium sp. NIES-64]|nr:unnamed protein product [Closterium sp. NIES-64]